MALQRSSRETRFCRKMGSGREVKIEVVEWAVRGLRRGMVGWSVDGDGSGQVLVGGGV